MRVGKRTAKLLREAIVLAHVEGSRWGQCHQRNDEYPTDAEVVMRVLVASTRLADLYPTLSKTEAAQAADAAYRRQSAELLAAVIGRQDGAPQ